MGRLNYEPVIQHFSHLHPLHLTTFNQTEASCAGCKLGATGWAYACAPCSYALHISCSKMPQLISHPVDPAHPLALLPVPAYAEGRFHCDACARPGSGFSYHCAACGLDFHAACASLPLTAQLRAHPHPLALCFSPPYENAKGFSCDVCGGLGSNHWLYRCSACEFDAHLGCATAQSSGDQVNPVRFSGIVGVNQELNRVGSGSGRGNANTIVHQMINGLVDGAGQQIGQSLVQRFLGGGGGGGGGVGGSGDGDGSGSALDTAFVSVLDVSSNIISGVFGGSDSYSTSEN